MDEKIRVLLEKNSKRLQTIYDEKEIPTIEDYEYIRDNNAQALALLEPCPTCGDSGRIPTFDPASGLADADFCPNCQQDEPPKELPKFKDIIGLYCDDEPDDEFNPKDNTEYIKLARRYWPQHETVNNLCDRLEEVDNLKGINHGDSAIVIIEDLEAKLEAAEKEGEYQRQRAFDANIKIKQQAERIKVLEKIFYTAFDAFGVAVGTKNIKDLKGGD